MAEASAARTCLLALGLLALSACYRLPESVLRPDSPPLAAVAGVYQPTLDALALAPDESALAMVRVSEAAFGLRMQTAARAQPGCAVLHLA